MIWLIGIGGSLGAAARYMIGNIMNKRTEKSYPFPVGTWFVNIVGSFLLGFITQLHLSNHIDEWIFLFGGVGFCGAFTTFSTFGYETITLLQANKIKPAVLYVLSSVAAGVVSAMIGFYI